MPVASTSVESFLEIQRVLAKRQRQVLEVFLRDPLGSFTDRDLVKLTGLPINCVTARRYELAGKGLIVRAKIVFDAETKRHVQAWRLAGGALSM
ncbi:MAG: hypothetical protein NWF09_08920 [Candidatus Bathyarchaeota archaeon]|nr:hypothetical protein [Candidatus Bathyarchaeota archaeon]